MQEITKIISELGPSSLNFVHFLQWEARNRGPSHAASSKERAEFFKKKLDESGAFGKPIVTAIEPFTNYYAAENYHQDYYNKNGNQPYCNYVIRPKLEKFEKAFKDKMKKQ